MQGDSKQAIKKFNSAKVQKLHDHINWWRNKQPLVILPDRNREESRYRTQLNIIKPTNEKHTANIILNEENIKAFPLNLDWNNGASSLHSYSIKCSTSHLEEYDNVKKIKPYKLERGNSNDHCLLMTCSNTFKDPKHFTRKLNVINVSSKLSGHKWSYKNL